MWSSAVAGAAVGAASGMMAWLFLSWAFSRGGRTFALVVVGGMMVRLVLVLGISLALLRYTALQAIAYLVSLVAVFITIQAIEVVYLRRRAGEKAPRSTGKI